MGVVVFAIVRMTLKVDDDIHDSDVKKSYKDDNDKKNDKDDNDKRWLRW